MCAVEQGKHQIQEMNVHIVKHFQYFHKAQRNAGKGQVHRCCKWLDLSESDDGIIKYY